MSKVLSKLFSSIFKEKITVEVLKDAELVKEADNSHELLSLSPQSLDYYRRFVKGNEGISEDQARRKLTRNMLLSFAYKQDGENKQYPRVWYSYGCLRFIVKDNKVVWIQNHQPVFKVWEKNHVLYEKLNKELGIKDKWNK